MVTRDAHCSLKPWRRILVWCVCVVALSACASSLNQAIGTGDVDAVRRELENGANPDGNYWTDRKLPAYQAASEGKLEVLQLLVEHGAKVHPGLPIIAAEQGRSNVIPYLVEHGGILTFCGMGDPALHLFTPPELGGFMPAIGFAIAARSLETVQVLVELGSPLEIVCDVPYAKPYNFSSILAASVIGDPRILESLLQAGANPNRLRVDGKTPIAIAAEQGNREVVRVLLAHGAFHTYSQAVKQPIEFASMNGHQDVVDLLTYAGASMPIRNIPSSSDSPSIGPTLADVAVLVGELWIIYEGVKYGDTAANHGMVAANDQVSRQTRNTRSSSPQVIEDGCNSDIQCQVTEVCLKKPGQLRGICVADGDHSRLVGSHDIVGSAFPRPIAARGAQDCPAGYRWDLVYEACVQ